MGPTASEKTWAGSKLLALSLCAALPLHRPYTQVAPLCFVHADSAGELVIRVERSMTAPRNNPPLISLRNSYNKEDLPLSNAGPAKGPGPGNRIPPVRAGGKPDKQDPQGSAG